MEDEGARSETWAEVLTHEGSPNENPFGTDFLAIYGMRRWQPNEADRRAAHSLHIELISRIATQFLGYSEGVEERALTSVFELFGKARAITEANPGGTTFESLVWHILNSRVRPFTAKWHAKSTAGALRALDSTDEFRAALVGVQAALIELDRALQAIKTEAGYAIYQKGRPDRDAIDAEMAMSVAWRPMGVNAVEHTGLSGDAQPAALAVSQEAVSTPCGVSSGALPADKKLVGFAKEERSAVMKRRARYNVDPNRPWATGLALSGGGIRSATFSIGVMVSLAKRNLLPQFDYLSTVSGGGYAGSFLTQLLGVEPDRLGLSLHGSDQPFTRHGGESGILRRIRQNASYLSGSLYERFAVAMAQAHGVFINLLVLALAAAAFSYVDYAIRLIVPDPITQWVALLSPLILAIVFIAIPLVRKKQRISKRTDTWMAPLGGIFLLPILWVALGALHGAWQPLGTEAGQFYSAATKDLSWLNKLAAWLTALGSASAVAGALLSTFSKLRPLLLTVLIFLLFIIAETTLYNLYFASGLVWATAILLACVALGIYLWMYLDINTTSLHGYYKAKLSAAFLINPALTAVTPMRLSNFDPTLAHFPIINCALNVPGSKNPNMRGRLSDVFAFTPIATGAPVVGYNSTAEWEKANPDLDLATAMALSGAAVSPQMGLRTTRYASFWLTVLNLRLDAWLRKPGPANAAALGPGLWHLKSELAATADERGGFVNISDGGHIENLGVYELLRRRCRYIVAIDGESDPKMTFHALTNLQRLAYIDFGIVLEADLDDLRLGQSGYSRSHFRFCRIIYPEGYQDSEEAIGYLVYLKLSLTGNEGEFLRRYKLDEPAFPHHATADQFFSESQFEAYRALGEHVGEKLFLPAITGPLGRNVDLEHWIGQLGRSFLDVRPAATGSKPAPAP